MTETFFAPCLSLIIEQSVRDEDRRFFLSPLLNGEMLAARNVSEVDLPYSASCVDVCWLLHVPVTCWCISETALLRK